MKQLLGIIIILVFLLHVSATNAQTDIDALGRALVAVYIDGNIYQTGIVATPNGHILTIPTVELANAFSDGTPVSVRFLSSDDNAQTNFTVSALVRDPEENLAALLQIDVLSIDSSTVLDIPYFNPIVVSAASSRLDRISAVAVSPLNSRRYLSVSGQINSLVIYGIDESFSPGIYYRSRISIGTVGQGGAMLNEDGGFVGLLKGSDQDTSTFEARPIEAICLNNMTICRTIIESARAEPQTRNRPSPGLVQLTNGIGLTNGGRVSDGQFQPEYYCDRLGFTLRVSENETAYECLDMNNPTFSFPLEAIHHDIICQQTYRNAEAIAFQISIADVSPVYSWRCYA